MLVVETIARFRREYFVTGKAIKEIGRDVKVSRDPRPVFKRLRHRHVLNDLVQGKSI